MNMFKRFKDSATGLFVTKAEAGRRPRETYASEPRLTIAERRVLREALNEQRDNPDIEESYLILRDAINKVLGL